ncbi:TPA: hypothetical protein ACTZ3S_005320 [Bacillus cereus]
MLAVGPNSRNDKEAALPLLAIRFKVPATASPALLTLYRGLAIR